MTENSSNKELESKEEGLDKTQCSSFESEMVLSPSEDQKTYVDIEKKIGVETVDKGISTDMVEPYKPLVKKLVVVKVNQECQTDVEMENEKKVVPKPAKPVLTRPAYSTAVSRNNVVKTTAAPIMKSLSKPEINKVNTLAKTTQRMTRPISLMINRPISERNVLSRSKTVSDIKPSTTLATRNRLERSKLTIPPSRPLPPRKPLEKSKITTPTRTLNPKNKCDSHELCSSSAETIINTFDQNKSFDGTPMENHITSSAENLNYKNKDLVTDGWLTVKCRSRFRNNGKRSSDPSNHWANRFNQVSATASLPALALLPENKIEPTTSINKSTKDNINTLKSQAKKVDNKSFIRRSNTTLSRTYVRSDFKAIKANIEKNKTMKKNEAMNDSETESDSKTKEDIQSEEEHRKETQRLTEEEAMLKKQIAELQCSDIDVDTETDGTETDGELQGEADCEGESEEPEDGLSLEAR